MSPSHLRQKENDLPASFGLSSYRVIRSPGRKPRKASTMSMRAMLVVLSWGAVQIAFAAEPADRPIGVDVENWIEITPRLGFVVVKTDDPAVPPVPNQPGSKLLLNEVSPPPSASGFFMIKTDRGWRRLVVLTPAELAKAAGERK